MSNSGEFYPEGAIKKEGGVMVVPSGYGGMEGSNGIIKLPTRVGSGVDERQFESVPIVVHTVNGGPGDEAPTAAPLVVAAPAPIEAPAPIAVTPLPPVVDSVGESADASSAQVPRNTATQNTGSVEAVLGIGVTLTHSTGFAFTTDWDMVVVTPPLSGVTTLALGLDPGKAIAIPEGDYKVEVEGDTYEAYFGNQSFQSDLKYYIFVIK